MRPTRVSVALALVCLAALLSPGSFTRAVSPDIVISQVYGGGGNSGATLKNDFIELYNRGDVGVDITGWSVQYASATGSTWQRTPLAGIVQPGRHYLIQQAAGAGGTVNLPAPDAIGSIPMSATAGKVALLRRNVTLPSGTSCPLADPDVADFVGFGAAANCFEGAGPTPTLSNTAAALRGADGATDTDNNNADFAAGAPTPRNSDPVTPPTGSGLATPSLVPAGTVSLLTVAVSPGTNPPSTGIVVVADLSTIGGSASQPFFDDGTNGDVTANDLTFSFQIAVAGTPAIYTLPATISDSRARSSSTTIRVAIRPAFTPIYTVQGSGAASPFAGQLVDTRGIVTARRNNGFYIQVPPDEADGDDETSDGILVFTSAAPPLSAAIGNAVRVVGFLSEFVPSSAPRSFPLTEITGVLAIELESTGHALPPPVLLGAANLRPDGGLEQLERFEGMRVRASLTVVAPTDGNVSETNARATSNGVFYGVLKGTARPMREPGYDPFQALPADVPCCLQRFDGNPERIRVDSDAQTGAPAIDIAAGQSIDDLTGVLDYGFFAYTILPDPDSPRAVQGDVEIVAAPAPRPNEFAVASFNFERFFDNVNDPAIGEPVLTADAFARRLAKASMTIREVLNLPDVLGAIEIENLATLQKIAERTNEDAVAAGLPDPQYDAYLKEGNDVGGIDVGFLVKRSRITVEGDVEQIGKDDTYLNVASGQLELLNDRPSLVLRALVHGSPGNNRFPVTIIVNHLRSLNGIDDAGLEGQRVRDKRRIQAERLADYVNLLQESNPAEQIISVGDYNAFQFNDAFGDSIGTIKGTPAPADQVLAPPSPDLVVRDLVNAGDLLASGAQYSFVFDGNAQALDHVLVNEQAFKRLTKMVYTRSNADFPESLRGDGTRPERLSDHDAAVAYFAIPSAAVATPAAARR